MKMERDEPINFVKVIPILKEVLSEKRITNTSEYAINWMKFMLESYQEKLIPDIKEIVEKIMEKIYESNGRNIYDIIENMKIREEYCDILIERMLAFMFQRGSENEQKVEIMIKKFIGSRDASKFLSIFCEKMLDYRSKQKFIYDISNSLNTIIVNEEAMSDIRKQLNRWEAESYKRVFMMLY
jgi:hypothetical protein